MRSLHRILRISFIGSKYNSCLQNYKHGLTTKQTLSSNMTTFNGIRNFSEAPEPLPLPADEIPEKVKNIVQQISSLNLWEVSQLNSHLKDKLGLSDMPVMTMGGAAQEQEEEEDKKPAQTEFTVKLIGFDQEKKIKLIKEIKSLLPDLNLVQAKKFVENPPGVIRKDIPKEEAEKLTELLSSLGGKIELE